MENSAYRCLNHTCLAATHCLLAVFNLLVLLCHIVNFVVAATLLLLGDALEVLALELIDHLDFSLARFASRCIISM